MAVKISPIIIDERPREAEQVQEASEKVQETTEPLTAQATVLQRWRRDKAPQARACGQAADD